MRERPRDASASRGRSSALAIVSRGGAEGAENGSRQWFTRRRGNAETCGERCRSLDSLRSLGMTASVIPSVVEGSVLLSGRHPAGLARSTCSVLGRVSAPPREIHSGSRLTSADALAVCASRIPHPASRIPHPAPRIPHPHPRTQRRLNTARTNPRLEYSSPLTLPTSDSRPNNRFTISAAPTPAASSRSISPIISSFHAALALS